jgi:hypothetical protein
MPDALRARQFYANVSYIIDSNRLADLGLIVTTLPQPLRILYIRKGLPLDTLAFDLL